MGCCHVLIRVLCDGPLQQNLCSPCTIHGLLVAQVEAMLNDGIFDMQKFVDGGWITGLRYEDEVTDDLKKRTGGKKDKLRSVSSDVLTR